jgi:hypothetical protein
MLRKRRKKNCYFFFTCVCFAETKSETDVHGCVINDPLNSILMGQNTWPNFSTRVALGWAISAPRNPLISGPHLLYIYCLSVHLLRFLISIFWNHSIFLLLLFFFLRKLFCCFIFEWFFTIQNWYLYINIRVVQWTIKGVFLTDRYSVVSFRYFQLKSVVLSWDFAVDSLPCTTWIVPRKRKRPSPRFN